MYQVESIFILGEWECERVCCPIRLLDSDLSTDESMFDVYFRDCAGRQDDSIQQLSFVFMLRGSNMPMYHRYVSYRS